MPSSTKPSTDRSPRRRGWRAAAVGAVLVGALAVAACSHGPFRGGHGATAAGPIDPERAARFVERMADRVIDAVDGTAEQRQRIQAIARAASDDLLPLGERTRTARRQSVELLGAATIDRAAIEALRADQIALADTASRRIAQALADTAEVLTPPQRTKLAERLQRRGWRGA